jgi:hypothetical protein
MCTARYRRLAWDELVDLRMHAPVHYRPSEGGLLDGIRPPRRRALAARDPPHVGWRRFRLSVERRSPKARPSHQAIEQRSLSRLERHLQFAARRNGTAQDRMQGTLGGELVTRLGDGRRKHERPTAV